MEKNTQKNSIREKYKRRQERLYIILQDYLFHASMRLDENVAGKAKDRETIEKIVKAVNALIEVIPIPVENNDDFEIDFEAVIASLRSVDDILKEGEEWEKSLTDDERKLIANYASSSPTYKKDIIIEELRDEIETLKREKLELEKPYQKSFLDD